MNQESLTIPFQEVVIGVTHLTGSERDRAIWNAALYWAIQNVHMEVIDEFTKEITEAKVNSVELMDEIYQFSEFSILLGIEREE